MRKLLLMGSVILLFTGQLVAQKSLTGTVTDDKGNPLPNVSVQIKGASLGTVTKLDGTYSLTAPANAKTLVFSSVDMGTQEVSIGSKSVIDVSLKGEDKTMQEVVVVGYGTQKKSHLTGAISKFKNEKLDETPVSRLDQALQGKIAGVQIQK